MSTSVPSILSNVKNLDVRVKIGLRNNALLCARESLGYSQRAVDKMAGVGSMAVNAYECLRMSPFRLNKKSKKMVLRASARKLLKFYNKTVEELFPDSLEKIKKNSIEFEFESSSLPKGFYLEASSPIPASGDVLDRKYLQDEMDQALKRLTPRQERVLKARFFEGKTLEEVGKTMSLTRDRIRQIEGAAIQKLRYPNRIGNLRSFEYADNDSVWKANMGYFKK